MWPFCRERPNRPNSPRRVLLMFREVSTCDPTIFGPNRPLIGAHLREQDAIATEALHPGFGVHWIDFDITEDPGTPAQPFVWVAVKADKLHERPEDDTDPVKVFGTLESGREWIATRARHGHLHRLWRVPLGQADPENPVWTDETNGSLAPEP